VYLGAFMKRDEGAERSQSPNSAKTQSLTTTRQKLRTRECFESIVLQLGVENKKKTSKKGKMSRSKCKFSFFTNLPVEILVSCSFTSSLALDVAREEGLFVLFLSFGAITMQSYAGSGGNGGRG
jgi:hypothetical protein